MKVALAIVLIGALNWGLIGFFNWNLVDAIFGGGAAEQTSGFARFVYAVVGLAAIISIPILGYHFTEAKAPAGGGRRAEVRP